MTISNSDEIIREINFHKGLNLIVDETNSENREETGNSVGKTTVLRLIDFCLGGDGSNVYKDPEFRDKTNTEIENFLKENNIVTTIHLVEDLFEESSNEITIRKNFLNYSDKIQEINGEYYNNKDFDSKLKELIFDTNVQKPTFRQIIAKNIRYEKNRLKNTLRVLHNTTKYEEYEALYFFWFGIDTDTASHKQKLLASKSTETSVLNRLKKESSISEINQALNVIERDIENLNNQKKAFNLNENYEQDLGELDSVRNEINSLTTEIGSLSIRREIIIESQKELEDEYVDIDANTLKQIYKTATEYLSEIHVKFEQLVEFHNNMLSERINYLTAELPDLEEKIKTLKANLSQKKQVEKNISEKLHNSGAVEEIEELIMRLSEKYQQKGKFEEQLRQWNKVQEKIGNIENELQKINEGINTQAKLLESRISSFNQYFSELSKKLYGEQFILSKDQNDRAFELKISSIGGNLGTGKKKGQIAAFDFAYVQFCDENDLKCLHFILHDQIENIHDNQIITIAEVANETNSQYIAPVLRDKLPSDINVEQFEVLSLSQKDKLFKV